MDGFKRNCDVSKLDILRAKLYQLNVHEYLEVKQSIISKNHPNMDRLKQNVDESLDHSPRQLIENIK